MSKIMQYFYIFSKLTTSLVLLFIIIIMGYALLKSYKKVDSLSKGLEFSLKPMNDSISNNIGNYLSLEEKLNNTETKVNEIKMILDKEISSKNENTYKEEIKDLLKLNTLLQSQINEISSNLTKYQNNKNVNLLKENNTHTWSLKDLIIMKYKNGDNIKDELVYLENSLEDKSISFEKLYAIEFKKFYGLNNLYKEFNLSSKNYVNNKFSNKNRNSILSFLFKFISIRPNNIDIYDNEELNTLTQSKKFIEKGDINNALKKILIIDSEKIFFSKWIIQAEIYLEFITAIEKVG
mgnify:CR=1 FL=1